LPNKQQHILVYGPPRGESARTGFHGILEYLRESLEDVKSEAYRETMMGYMTATLCRACGGHRLRPESLAVTVGELSIGAFTALPLEQAVEAARALQFSAREALVAERIRREVVERLEFLVGVGLGYLTLDRSAATISGGEGQRIRLATQIGSRLRGVLYVLDEPSIGLHQRDNQRLIEALIRLRDLGNTVLVVEHDEDTIRAADYVLDLGPGAGRLGGEVVAEGTPQQIMAVPDSLTGQYLSGKKTILHRPQPRRLTGRWITIQGAREHNLRDVTVRLPLGVMTVVTGVSGSGKSTLVNDILYRSLAQTIYSSREEPGNHDAIEGAEQIDKVIRIDQSPIGRTPRSNPATYTQLFTPLRDLFAMLPESRERGYKAGRFSFNVVGGRCEACEGDGQRRIEMNFLPDVYVQCEVCGGKRYNQETLAVKFNGYSIADVLDLTIEDALTVFTDVPLLRVKLQTLVDVGLGYVHLGQSATTLSGGEAQRMKLARELSKRQTGRTMYLLDEPTTGLHFDDVRKLLEVLHRLTDIGNSVVMIEHNLDVIRNADWIIDMGPEGGAGGGLLVAEGRPLAVAACPHSHTGAFLHKFFVQHGAPEAVTDEPLAPEESLETAPKSRKSDTGSGTKRSPKSSAKPSSKHSLKKTPEPTAKAAETTTGKRGKVKA
jgi:excinuclease ABC subunit A